jgi:tetratricopeptide (TPR) repeat protein
VLGLFITGIIVSLTTVFYSWKADADERSFEAGIGAIRSREYGLASAILERTVQANPSNARAFYELGTTYAVLNEGPKAIAALNESIRLDPTSDQAYIARGIQYFHDGDVPSSLKDFTQAVAIRPSMESYLQKGLALQALGLHQAAIEAFDEAIRRRTTTDNSMDMAKKASIRALKEEKRKPVRGGA